MIIEEKDFREAVRRVVRSVIVIVALSVMKNVVASLNVAGGDFAGVSFSVWVALVISLVIVALLFTLYQPVKAIITFYLAVLVKVGKMPERDKYLNNLIAVAGNLTLLIFLLSIYSYLEPVIVLCNAAFLQFSALVTSLNVVVLLAVIGILLVLWKNAQPLVDLLTGKITDTVSTLSSNIAFVNCPAYNAKNDLDAAFCASCGGKMVPPTVSKNSCPQCAAENAPTAKFCYKCGTAIR